LLLPENSFLVLCEVGRQSGISASVLQAWQKSASGIRCWKKREKIYISAVQRPLIL